jgi:hypothetical protein
LVSNPRRIRLIRRRIRRRKIHRNNNSSY